jgi:hypothetical protein
MKRYDDTREIQQHPSFQYSKEYEYKTVSCFRTVHLDACIAGTRSNEKISHSLMQHRTKLVSYSQSLLRKHRNYSISASALEDCFSFGSFSELAAQLRSNLFENSLQKDSVKVRGIIRFCCDDPSFFSHTAAPSIAISFLRNQESRVEGCNDMLAMMISKILTESTVLSKEHLVLYKRCRSIPWMLPHLPNFLSRFEDHSVTLSDWSPSEVALWLDFLSHSKQYQPIIHAQLSNSAIQMLSVHSPSIDPKTVSLLLRSLSYCQAVAQDDSCQAVIGAFKHIIPQFHSFNHIHALTTMRAIRRMFPNREWEKKSIISEFVDLCFVEIFRNFHSLKSHDLVDCFIISPLDSRLRDTVISSLPELTTRQLSLVLWSLLRSPDTNLVDKIIHHLDTVEITSCRDWALILYSVSKLPTSCDKNNLLAKFFDQKLKLRNLQEYSMILSSAIRIAGPHDGRVIDLLRNDVLLSVPRTTSSVPSILSTLHSISLIRKSSPLIPELGRVLYSRVSSMTSNQAAFAFSLLKSDETISRTFLPIIDPRRITNNNLVNLVVALSIRKNEPNYVFIDEVYARAKTLKPDYFVAAIDAIARMDDRKGELESSDFIHRLRSIEDLVSFTPRALVDLFVSMESILRPQISDEIFSKIRDTLCVVLIEKLKTSSHAHWGGPELILMAQELVRLGRSGVKPNLRDRFLIRLLIGIKTRAIPTRLLLDNLKVVDSLGTFHQLPIFLQEHLYKKATPEQREGVSRPKLVKISPIEKLKVREVKPDQRLDLGEEQSESFHEQQIEIEQMEETAVSQFIQKIRQHNNN